MKCKMAAQDWPKPLISLRHAAAWEIALLPNIEYRADAVYADYPEFADLQNQQSIVPGRADDLPPGAIVILAEMDSALSGFIFGHPLDDCLFVGQLSVVPEAQKQGIGSRLLAALGDAAQQAGCPGLSLITYGHLPFNAPFYARRGFRVLREDELSPEIAKEYATDTAKWSRYGPRVVMGRRFAD